MKIFNMVLFGWPVFPKEVEVGQPGSYPVHNKYFDPVTGQKVLQDFLEEIDLSEALGFDGVNCQEHHDKWRHTPLNPLPSGCGSIIR